MPSIVYPQASTEEWQASIVKHFLQLADLDAPAAKKLFLRRAESLALFGAAVFSFKVSLGDPRGERHVAGLHG